jgi:hypothetical protein
MGQVQGLNLMLDHGRRRHAFRRGMSAGWEGGFVGVYWWGQGRRPEAEEHFVGAGVPWARQLEKQL